MLTINGGSFSTTGQVTIGGNVCFYNTWTHTQITCTLPAGAGAASPLVINAGGQVNLAATFKYDAPAISSLSPTGAVSGSAILLTITVISPPSCRSFSLLLLTVPALGLFFPLINRGSLLRCACGIDAGHELRRDGLRDGQLAAVQLLAVAVRPHAHPVLAADGHGLPGPRRRLGQRTKQPRRQLRIRCEITSFAVRFFGNAHSSASVPVRCALCPCAAPVISSISLPSGAPTQGAVSMVLNGQSFASTAVTSVSVLVAGLYPCTPITASSTTQITCTLPAGQGLASCYLPPAFLPPAVSSYRPALRC